MANKFRVADTSKVVGSRMDFVYPWMQADSASRACNLEDSFAVMRFSLCVLAFPSSEFRRQKESLYI